jgi:hypothetical protein
VDIEWKIRLIWVSISQLKILWFSQTRINNEMKCLVAERAEILFSNVVTVDLPYNILHSISYNTCRRSEGRSLQLLLPVAIEENINCDMAWSCVYVMMDPVLA